MASTKVGDENDYEHSYASSQSEEEDSIHESFDESDYGNSDCSVTSGVDGSIREATIPQMDRQVLDLAILQADESVDTTWTDDKHSSYLDSMEATFVRKMYDKEYCSVDVCGHSSHSSISLDHDCVESQPFCLNMRKPSEQGLLTFNAATRPVSLMPSMLASPWIQHFKSRKSITVKDAEAHDGATDTHTLHHVPTTSEKESKSTSTPHLGSPDFNKELDAKKRGALGNHSDCATNLMGYTLTTRSHFGQGGGFKKIKCQQSILAHMDMLMEQQYNAEHHGNLGAETHTDGDNGQIQMKSDSIKACDELVPAEITTVREKHDQMMGIKAGPSTMLAEGLQKVDQVVPSFRCEEACGQHVLPNTVLAPIKQTVLVHDMLTTAEDACADNEDVLTEHEVITARSGSKTRTWGIQGPRYPLNGKYAPHYHGSM